MEDLAENRYTGVPQREVYKETNVDLGGVSLQEDPGPSQPTSSRFDRERMKQPIIIVAVVVAIIAFLLVILLPISYSTLEYYEIGFKRRKSTGLIERSQTYGPGGRYLIGPDYGLQPFQADAHFESFSRVSVFAKDRLQVSISAEMQYFLRVDQMNLLHKKYDIRYKPIIYTNAVNALKNKATSYSTREFIRNRTRIEQDLFLAVRDMLSGPCCEKDCQKNRVCIPGCLSYASCKESQFGFYVDVRYFQLNVLDIPNDLENKFLRGLTLTEESEAEEYKQNATIVRKKTDQEVKAIENDAHQLSEDAMAKSDLIKSMATANSTSIIEDARSNGLKFLYSELGIVDQKEKASFDYLRTLRGQSNVHLAVDFDQLIAGSLGSK